MTENLLNKEELGKRIVRTSRITGKFRLRSGATSDVYFDKYRFESEPDLLSEIAHHMGLMVPAGTDRLIGLEMGGIPLATAIGLHLDGNIRTGFCRKKAKEYGTCRQIEGGVDPGEKVTIIEDVITSGGAAVEAVKALRKAGNEILALLCVVDREAGGREKFNELGVDFRALFTWSELEKLREPRP